VQESVHDVTTIDRPAAEVYGYAADPTNLSNGVAGLAHQPVEHIGARVVD